MIIFGVPNLEHLYLTYFKCMFINIDTFYPNKNNIIDNLNNNMLINQMISQQVNDYFINVF